MNYVTFFSFQQDEAELIDQMALKTMRQANIKASHYLLVLLTPPHLTYHVQSCCNMDEMVTAEAGCYKLPAEATERGMICSIFCH